MVTSVFMIFTYFRYGAGQLKIMFVGGPNTRKDYHVDEGEEVRRFCVYHGCST